MLLQGKDGSKYVTVTLGDDGSPRFDAKIPEGYSGKHTIVLLDEKGSQIAWTTVWVIPANATSFAETIAEDNLKYSENNFGSVLGSSSGFGFDSDYENYESSSNSANDYLSSGGSASGSASGNDADANGSGNKSGSRSKANGAAKSGTSNSASSKETNANSMLSKLSATGVGTVSTLVTVTLLMLIGAFALIASRLRNRSIK